MLRVVNYSHSYNKVSFTKILFIVCYSVHSLPHELANKLPSLFFNSTDIKNKIDLKTRMICLSKDTDAYIPSFTILQLVERRY